MSDNNSNDGFKFEKQVCKSFRKQTCLDNTRVTTKSENKKCGVDLIICTKPNHSLLSQNIQRLYLDNPNNVHIIHQQQNLNAVLVDIKYQPQAIIHGSVNLELERYVTSNPSIKTKSTFYTSYATEYWWYIGDDNIYRLKHCDIKQLVDDNNNGITNEHVTYCSSNNINAILSNRRYNNKYGIVDSCDNATSLKISTDWVKQHGRAMACQPDGTLLL